MRVSIDSFDPAEIRTAVAAGAEMVLSLNRSNLEVGRELRGTGATAVVIPDLGEGLDTLAPSIEALEGWGVPYLLDPIIEPIGFGFMASLERYAEVRRRYPDAGQMMGIGNITELTSADTTGVNALLIAICEELGVRAVLTTEVIPWARGAVREIDIARRLMHHAVAHRTIPKGVDDRLVTVKDPEILDGTRRSCAGSTRRSPIPTSGSSPTAPRSPSSTTRSSSAATTSSRSSRSSAWTRRPTRSIWDGS